ncbi:MAG: hypothetical protein ABL994_02420 [Verrucomicrobiales bacterium]
MKGSLIISLVLFLSAAEASINDFRDLIRVETWQEIWPDSSGDLASRSVTAEVWTEAMQAGLDSRKTLHLPARELPYYIDAPLILSSGQTLTADPGAEIRLKPGTNTCMVRNKNLIGFADRVVPSGTLPDTDITIAGGIWTTLSTAAGETNGNLRGASSKDNAVPGTHGVILLQNVRRVVVKNVTVRQSRAFAVHLANSHEFTVDGITLEGHRRDGVHVNGPASDGFIRGVSGDSHDDTVALNAWEWKNYAPSFGPIHDIVIDEVRGAPEGMPSANSIRLLAGRKRFSDGVILDCPIHNITLRRITDITEFKLYDQPNLELGRDKDYSIGVGTIRNLHFEDLTFRRPGRIEIHAEVDGLTLRNATVESEGPLISIGPKSGTYKFGSDPARWVEIFSPDLDCTVKNVVVSGVRLYGETGEIPPERLIEVIEQKINPDYPQTTPRGGTGRGIWIQ